MTTNGQLKQAITKRAYERYDRQEATDFERLMILFHEEHVETRQAICEEGARTRRTIHEEAEATREHFDRAVEGGGTNKAEKGGIFISVGTALTALGKSFGIG